SFFRPQVFEQSVHSIDFSFIRQRRSVLDWFSVGISLAPAPRRIVVFQREAERIDAGMAIGGGGVALVLFQLGFQRQAAERVVVGGQRSRVGGRRRRRGSKYATQNPVAALHGTRAQRRGCHRQNSAEAKQSAALELAGAFYQLHSIRGLDLLLDAVKPGQ